jgi:hypothetical protein
MLFTFIELQIITIFRPFFQPVRITANLSKLAVAGALRFDPEAKCMSMRVLVGILFIRKF